MGLLVAGQVIATADQATTPPTWYHLFTPTLHFELKAIQTWVVKYGSPTCDFVGCALYSTNITHLERQLIATSTTVWQPSEISGDNYGVKQVYFNFEGPVLLRKGTEYAISLTFDTYTADEDNHFAWVRSWPDPVVSFTGDTDYNALNSFPFHVGFIGREARP